ncbi:uncharacterized protein [Nicotiana sylvestris]|uniref:uncharacterized protein n=1 Tax=Nicotiana sylvestris TaxID=4096 RepID=UPI00388CDF42
MVCEWKEKLQGEHLGTAQLGMIRLCGTVTKQAIQPTENGNQYVDHTINNKPAREMVDIGATHNFVTEGAAKRLELNLAPTNSQVKTVNFEVQDACGVANGVGIKLGAWKVTMPYKQSQAQLSAMQVVKGMKKGEPMFVATSVSLKEANGFQETQPPCIEKLLEENKDFMPEKLPKHFPPRQEVDHKIELEARSKPPAFSPYRMAPPELEEIKKQLKGLLDAGQIYPSKAPFSALVLFQKKKEWIVALVYRLPST